MLRLCAAVRAEAAGLVDAFGLSDFVIGSPLGRADGDVYRAYMARVQAVPGAAGPTPVRQGGLGREGGGGGGARW